MRIILSLLLSLLFVACSQTDEIVSSDPAVIDQIDSLINSHRRDRSLESFLLSLTTDQDVTRQTLAYDELGSFYRNNAQFIKAVQYHTIALELAERRCDTVLIIRALNDIGIDYKRTNMLNVAAQYHYRALDMCDEYSVESDVATKNKCKSLTGIGNIFHSIGNLEMADSLFRESLKGEERLGSDYGMAIGNASMGFVFEKREMYDSARVYYDRAMDYNRLARNEIGQALCHLYYGNLFTREGNLDAALMEYEIAYGIMRESNRQWEALKACLALAKIYARKGQKEKSERYLNESLVMAHNIKNHDQLAHIHRLLYEIYDERGDKARALASHVASCAHQDSVLTDNTYNGIRDMQVSGDRRRKVLENEVINRRFAAIQYRRMVNSFIFGGLIVVLLIVVVATLVVLRQKRQQQAVLRGLQNIKDRFFTNITNEFRTPLKVIETEAEEIRGPLSADAVTVRHNASTIIQQSRALMSLINQILDIAMLTSSENTQKPVWRNGDILSFISLICDSYVDFAARKGIALTHTHKVMHVRMDFIPDYTEKIIRNLISNAVKFTPSGGFISITTHIDSHNNFHISVRDTGIGMSKEQIDHVFEPFYVGANETDDKVLGPGVGLSLVKISVDAMGGDVAIDSTVNKGSTFDVRLPISNEHAELTATDLGVILPANPDPANSDAFSVSDTEEDVTGDVFILVIDSTTDIASKIKVTGQRSGSVLCASSGAEGQAKALEILPDLVYINSQLPDVDGYSLCKQLKDNEITAHIPVVMLVPDDNGLAEQMAKDAKAESIVQRTIEESGINGVTERILLSYELRRKKFSGILRDDTKSAHESQTVGAMSGVRPADITTADTEYFVRVTNVIKHFMTSSEMNVAFIADKMGLTRRQLNRKVGSLCGMSAQGLVNQIRINAAKDLLLTSNMSLNDIAIRCGISGITYFNTLFKDSTGMTPRQYREEGAMKG